MAAQKIEGLRLTDEARGTRIILDLSSALPYSIFSLADPYRIVIDLPEIDWASKSRSASTHAGLVSGYRFGLFQPSNSRLVLDLARPARIASSYYLPPSAGKKMAATRPRRLVIVLEPIDRNGFLKSAGFNQRNSPPLDAKPPVEHARDLSPSTPPVKLPAVAQPPVAAPVQTGNQQAALVSPPHPVLLPVAPLPGAVPPPAPNKAPGQSGPPGKRQPIVVIDAGHGGVDPGAVTAQGIYEKTIVLDTARKLQIFLRRHGRYKVVMTRDKDVFVRLGDRVEIARSSQADLLVSIHADTLSSGKVRGASVYTLSEQASDKEAELLAAKENNSDMIAGIGIGDETDELVKTILIDLAQRETANKSVHFAKLLLPKLNNAGTLLKNSHRFAGFRVLKAPDVPSVLVELGLLSNSTDARTLTSDAGRARLAEAIRQAIDNYFRDLQT